MIVISGGSIIVGRVVTNEVSNETRTMVISEESEGCSCDDEVSSNVVIPVTAPDPELQINNFIGVGIFESDTQYSNNVRIGNQNIDEIDLIGSALNIPKNNGRPRQYSTGSMYFDTGDRKIYYYDGRRWKKM